MADERLQFGSGKGDYNAVYASQHLARYLVLQGKCRGKRVLDAACGEGFGSYLMAEWGADHVLGVDIAADAIASAIEHFSHEKVRYIQYDVEDVDTLLVNEPQFDVLACFETIEHLRHPAKFLTAVAKVLKPDALIVISCPNDKCALAPGQVNPYHLAEYTFDEFRALTTAHLGNAHQWMFGTPVNGTISIDAADGSALRAAIEMRQIIDFCPFHGMGLMPSQANVLPTPESCLYFLGVWGGTLPGAAAVSPASYTSFIEPWGQIENIRTRLADTEQRQEQLQNELADAEARVQAFAIRDERQQIKLEQLAYYRRLVPGYRWLLGHLRRRLLGKPLPIIPPGPELSLPVPLDSDRLMIEASGLFDPAWYVDRYPDVAGVDPLGHYMKYGWREGRSPSQGFNPSWYLSQGAAQPGGNPLVHYIRYGIAQGRSPCPNQTASRAAEQTVADVSRFEPDIAGAVEFKQIGRLDFHLPLNDSLLYRAWRKLFASLESPYDYLVFLPWLTHGGAEQEALNVVRAAIERHGPGATLLVATDHDRVEAKDWLPQTAELRVFSDFAGDLSHEDRIRLVELLVLALKPRAIMNVNSRACWDAIRQKGKALSSITRLYGALFCRDYTEDGRAAGYSDTHFRECLPYLTKIYFDNAAFIQTLILDYAVPESLRARLVVLRQPAPSPSGARGFMQGGGAAPLKVLWAGRLARQKNINMVIEIAGRAPDFHFDVYGSGDETLVKRLSEAELRLPNLSYRGGFSRAEAFPTQQYGAFLLTSLWEGLPNLLITIGSLGLPIVASDVGGVSELVDDETGWLIRDHLRPEAYVQALNEIARDPGIAESRVQRMIGRLQSRHSWASFVHALAEPPSFLD